MSTDFFPTFVRAAGAKLPAGRKVDGVDIMPLLEGDEQVDRDALYWHYPHYSNQGGFPAGAIRVKNWKLVERYEDGRVHLYDLANDIGEQHDVASLHANRVAEMRTRLHDWYLDVDAKFLKPKPDGPSPWKPSR